MNLKAKFPKTHRSRLAVCLTLSQAPQRTRRGRQLVRDPARRRTAIVDNQNPASLALLD
jgi:hypothetical protein